MQWRTKAHYGAVTIPAVTILWDSPLAFLQGPEPAHRTMHGAASNCSSLLATQSPSLGWRQRSRVQDGVPTSCVLLLLPALSIPCSF